MLDSTAISLGGIAGVEDKTTGAKQDLAATYNQFLTLLTVQLKNQDPLNPMDSKDFTNQLINMANAEQSIAQTAKLDELIKLNQTAAINSSLVSYIGMGVEYEGKDFAYSGGQSIQFDYTLKDDAATTTINILNDKDEVVWTSEGEKTEGDHQIVWPGVDKDGKRVEAGKYHIKIISKDAEGGDVATTTPVEDFNYSANSSSMTLKYKLESEATSAKATIYDAEGKIVWTGDVDKKAGENSFVWPGTDKDGKPVSAGYYTVEVGAKNKDDKAVKTTTIVPAIVGGVQAEDGTIKLLIGGQKVSIDAVKAVYLPS